MIRTSLKRYKLLFIFLSVIIIIGLISGFFYYLKLDDSLQNLIGNEISYLIDEKNIIGFNFYRVMMIIFTSLLSFLLIGTIIGAFCLFYESFSVGVIVCAFIKDYALNGVFYSLIYMLFSKLLFLVIISMSILVSFKLFKNIISKNNKYNNYYLNIYKYVKVFIFLIFLGIINEVALMPLANKVCCYLSFIIK